MVGKIVITKKSLLALKYTKNAFAAGDLPRTPLEELQHSPISFSSILEAAASCHGERKGKREEEERRGREGKAGQGLNKLCGDD